MDLMSLTRASLLRLCEELDVEVEDDKSEAEIRAILESNRDQKYFEHFGNLILKEQEQEAIEQEKELKRQEWIKQQYEEIEALNWMAALR